MFTEGMKEKGRRGGIVKPPPKNAMMMTRGEESEPEDDGAIPCSIQFGAFLITGVKSPSAVGSVLLFL